MTTRHASAAAYTQSYAFCVPRAMDGAPLSGAKRAVAGVQEQREARSSQSEGGRHEATLISGSVVAQQFPTRPIRVVVPFPAP